MRNPRRAATERPGTGLPCESRERGRGSSLSDPEERAARDLDRKRIVLVAEDDASLRELIALSLRKDGYEVTEATDGAALLDELGALWLQERIPDLIITDVRTPRSSGLELLARLRNPEWTIPVIVITAFGERTLHKEARDLGAFDVLDKPFRMSGLRAIVADVFKAVRP